MLSPDHIVVRLAANADVDTLVALSSAMAKETEGRRLNQARLREGTLALLATPDRGYFMVAEIPGQSCRRIVGQLMVTFEWSDWRNGVFWWVQSVYVDPPWRRQGVYRAMYDHLVRKAKGDRNVCGIRLYVKRDNRRAQAVYRRVGLTSSGYAVFEEDFVLRKRTSSQRKR